MVGGQRSGVLGHFTLRGESFLLVDPEQLTMEVSLGTGGCLILRGVGWFVIFVGFNMMAGILVTLGMYFTCEWCYIHGICGATYGVSF